MTTQESLEKSDRPDENTDCQTSPTLTAALQTAVMTWLRGWHKEMSLEYEGVNLGDLMMYELSQRLNTGLVVDG